MGQTQYKYTCVLGRYNIQGIGVMGDEELTTGRYVHTEFPLTDMFVKFVNDDVLPRVNAEARFIRAEKISEHELFLTHNEAAELDPRAAIQPYVNTLKGLLSLLEADDPDNFLVLRFGAQAVRGYVLPSTTSPDPHQRFAAISSHVPAFGGAGDS